MATILLSAAGAAIGSGVGGSVLGLSGTVLGRAVGATIGQSLDQRNIGAASNSTSIGRIDRLHLSGVGYGTPIKQVWGRVRIAGEIIWASRFLETRTVSTGSKGNSGPRSEVFSYSVSIAIALCEGEALAVGRVWADGTEIALNSLDLRFYSGSEEQLPDPKIEAVEGIGFAPSYRGTCYIVVENLNIARFGNRVPQLSFEVIRRANSQTELDYSDLPGAINAVALIPGSGEYALATTPVHLNLDLGLNKSTNVHSIQGVTDFSYSLTQMNHELPKCQSVSLVVSWFGNDLRCNICRIEPKVEQKTFDGVEMPWVVSGVDRNTAEVLKKVNDRPIYGGTPTDRSVIEAIAAIRASGKEVMFYPFILMDLLADDSLPNPWVVPMFQPSLPWRGRITLSIAPGLEGSLDKTAGATQEISDFMGTAGPQDFTLSSDTVEYIGAPEWGYRRFILHYAHLCVLAGGVDAFCIGSEMRGLTTVRSSTSDFPMVEALKQLASDVRLILGSASKITYAADWTEYFGYHSGNDVLFHLDDLWSDPAIDFIGIDNYMPLSDWRDGLDHADSHWSSEYNVEYLLANVMGGEGYDWYYDSNEGENEQRRLKIIDIAHGEDWVFRFKDIRSWWENDHHNRVDGVRSENSTNWIPQMKKVVFTEYGCSAINKGSNNPNRFVDLKSSESSLPRGSNGCRDDLVQMTYYEVMARYWRNVSNNPISLFYGEPMVDFDRAHAWAWDARPYPDFPGAVQLWSDAENYDRGHWLNGRTSNQSLQVVLDDIFKRTDADIELNSELASGIIKGYIADSSQPPRNLLDTILAIRRTQLREVDGHFEAVPLYTSDVVKINFDHLVEVPKLTSSTGRQRSASVEMFGRLKFAFVQAESDHEVQIVESFINNFSNGIVSIETASLETYADACHIAEHLLWQSNASLIGMRIALPKSLIDLAIGDIVSLQSREYRIVEMAEAESLIIDLVEVESESVMSLELTTLRPVRFPSVAATPAFTTFLDIPILDDDASSYSPFAAIVSNPWPGSVSVWSSSTDSGFELNTVISSPSVVGQTLSDLFYSPSGVWDYGSEFRVRLSSGFLESRSQLDVLNGSNTLAIGIPDTDDWEILQFSEAQTVGPNTYDVSGLLRGLAGTDATMPPVWPMGSLVVLVDRSLQKIALPVSFIGLNRFYRVGATDLGVADENAISVSRSFSGVGLRPYSVVHLSAFRATGGDVAIRWIRRSRLDGDRWHYGDVPLGEIGQEFTLRIIVGTEVIRECLCLDVLFTYDSQMQIADNVLGTFICSVSQNSSSFGPGPESRITVG